MNKRRLITVVAVLLGIAALVGFLLFSRSQKQPESQIATSSPPATIDPFQADRGVIERLSKEFGARFLTYSRPDDPTYLASIRPYMTEQFFTENTRLTAKDRITLEHSTPISSRERGAEVTDISSDHATSEVTLSSAEPSGEPYTQVILLQWINENGLWHVNAVGIQNTTRGE